MAWCSAASRLLDTLPQTWSKELLLLETPPAVPQTTQRSVCELNTHADADCPGRRLRPSAALVALVRAHVATLTARLPQRDLDFVRRMGPQLFKWELFALTSYDAILYADVDVDLFPERLSPAPVRAEWAAKLPRLLRTRPSARLVGRADFSSPLNGGLFLLRPDASLHADGLRVLAAGSTSPFDEVLGWNRSGAPAALLAARTLRHHDGSPLLHRQKPAVGRVAQLRIWRLPQTKGITGATGPLQPVATSAHT